MFPEMMLITAALVAGFAAASHRQWVGPNDAPICAACKYARIGLPPDAPCPECGTPRPGAHSGVHVTRWSRADLIDWLTVAALQILFGALSNHALPLSAALSYRLNGFTWGTSFRAARLRDSGVLGGAVPAFLIVFLMFYVFWLPAGKPRVVVALVMWLVAFIGNALMMSGGN